MIKAYALTITHKKISVKTQIESMTMLIDAEKLHTILDNLISNAVKYTPDGGEISIRAMESRASLAMALSAKSMVTIEVKDTGPGISESNKSGIFSAFYHGEQASKSLVASSGLGLFIAKEAADALNAELSLIPSQIGAHFILRIPLITQ